ncbi:hypothetical protein F5877DRAFT_71943 [Lentinula edodes]|nr:hypothetical protein F5877DRAFT_71943 [Lentinula edodes]
MSVHVSVERSSMASGSFVYENRTVWDVEDSWNLFSWQDFDDNMPQVDQSSSVTESGLSSPSKHSPHSNDSQRTLSPNSYNINRHVALLNNDPDYDHNDASISCNSKALQEQRQHVSVAIHNPKRCLPQPDTNLANDTGTSTTKPNSKLIKTITHLKQSREYLECLEAYSLTYMRTRSLRSILVFMENMMVRMSAQIQTEEERFHELQKRFHIFQDFCLRAQGNLSIKDCREVLKAQGRVYVGGVGSQVWPQGMLVKDMVDGFELVQGDFWKPLGKQQRILEVFRGSTVLLQEYQEQEKVWLLMSECELDAAKGELADVVWTVWQQEIQGTNISHVCEPLSFMTYRMTDGLAASMHDVEKASIYPLTLKRQERNRERGAALQNGWQKIQNINLNCVQQ